MVGVLGDVGLRLQLFQSAIYSMSFDFRVRQILCLCERDSKKEKGEIESGRKAAVERKRGGTINGT